MRCKSELVYFVFICVFCSGVFVSGADSDYCADVFVSSIEPSSVEADEDFTVGLQIENCGEEIVDNVYLEVVKSSQ